MDLSFLASIKPLQYLVVFGGIALLILLLGKLSKKGLFSFQGKGVKIGGFWQDLERRIIRQQLQYVTASIEEFFSEIERKSTWNEWKAKYTAEKVKDVFESAISFNHISKDHVYTSVKCKEVWSQIQTIGMDDPYYRSTEFKSLIYSFVEKTIADMVDIREYNLEQNSK